MGQFIMLFLSCLIRPFYNFILFIPTFWNLIMPWICNIALLQQHLNFSTMNVKKLNKIALKELLVPPEKYDIIEWGVALGLNNGLQTNFTFSNPT